ncbi:MAG: outer membrane beta-barrel protein [Anaerolineales bacterium]|nr:outer membrane beta-barrel protein [Anaerolineales bacterium]
MKWIKRLCVCLLAIFSAQSVFSAMIKPYQINNRLRVEYDDNINQTETDKETSWKVIEEIEFLINFNLQNTYVGLRYRPSYVWWDREPEGGSSDFQHELDFVLNQTFSPRLSLSVVDTLRRGESPRQIIATNGVPENVNGDFYYNTLNGTLGYLLRPATRLELSGRWVAQRYDNKAYSDSEFDNYVGGLTLRHQWVPETTLIGAFRYEAVDYNGLDRGSKSLYAGGGVEQIFSPNLIGSLGGGYQRKDFNSDQISSETSPYVDVSATFLPSPSTRISGGVGYSMFESEVFPFANQDRAQVFGSLAHDFTARVSFYLTGSYTIGSYDAEQTVEDPENPTITAKDGDDNVGQVSTRVTYQLNRSNWLEAGWQYVDFDSKLKYSNGNKLRESYKENRIDVGWKTQF